MFYQLIITKMEDAKEIKNRLEYLRQQLRGECISYGELHELQSLAEHIEKDDVELLEAAGVPEDGGIWKCTDPDTNQWGRRTGEKVYQFKQDVKYPDGVVITEEDTIDLNDYTREEIEDHLAPYGWSIAQLKEENDLEDAEWLMAECIFEQTVLH